MAARTQSNGNLRKLWPGSVEQRLKELGIQLPSLPEPFGIYAEAVYAGNLVFLTGMLHMEGRALTVLMEEVGRWYGS